MHMGIPTMRGDFEILGYNMIQWLCGSLPWENNLTDPSAVQRQKESAFDDLPGFLKKCFPQAVPESINNFMKLLDIVKLNSAPNYIKLKEILVKGLRDIGHRPDGKLEFNSSNFLLPSVIGMDNICHESDRKLELFGSRKPWKTSTPMSGKREISHARKVSNLVVKVTRKGKEVVHRNIEMADDFGVNIEITIGLKRRNGKDKADQI